VRGAPRAWFEARDLSRCAQKLRATRGSSFGVSKWRCLVFPPSPCGLSWPMSRDACRAAFWLLPAAASWRYSSGMRSLLVSFDGLHASVTMVEHVRYDQSIFWRGCPPPSWSLTRPLHFPVSVMCATPKGVHYNDSKEARVRASRRLCTLGQARVVASIARTGSMHSKKI
jgi:hypothetical protein